MPCQSGNTMSVWQYHVSLAIPGQSGNTMSVWQYHVSLTVPCQSANPYAMSVLVSLSMSCQPANWRSVHVTWPLWLPIEIWSSIVYWPCYLFTGFVTKAIRSCQLCGCFFICNCLPCEISLQFIPGPGPGYIFFISKLGLRKRHWIKGRYWEIRDMVKS